jgi:hypothetical protein
MFTDKSKREKKSGKPIREKNVRKSDVSSVGTAPKKLRDTIVGAVSAILSAAVIATAIYFSVVGNGIGYYEYFNNFTSSPKVSAECTLALSEGTSVESYDPVERVFITQRKYADSTVLYGFASAEKEYCQPVYYKIIVTHGDYAVVVKITSSSLYDSIYYIGVVKYRGDGISVPQNYSDFGLVYCDSYDQITFVGDYVCVRGSLDETSSTSTYATFYDYKSGGELLEKFRLRYSYDSVTSDFYSYVYGDGYLAAYTTDKAYFFDTENGVLYGGYLETVADGEYVAFSAFGDELDSYSREMRIYYIGNGWFVRSSILYLLSAFNGFNICFYKGSTLVYARAKTDFYNVKTGDTSSVGQINLVAGVANGYNADYYTEYSYMLGNADVADDSGTRYEYDLPYSDPSALVKGGYTILYFYYLPYFDVYADDTTTYLGYFGETTYCILDENLDVTLVESGLMPTEYVDGVGVQTSDPIYTQLTGDAYCYDSNMEGTLLAKYISGSESYTSMYGDANGVVVRKTVKSDSGEETDDTDDDEEYYYGIINTEGKIVVDFIYSELTPFSGGYAIGTRTENGTVKTYRIDESGAETEITDSVSVKQGTYIFRSGDCYGVKNYAGDVLIDAECAAVFICDISLQDGEADVSYAVTTVGSNQFIYEIK